MSDNAIHEIYQVIFYSWQLKKLVLCPPVLKCSDRSTHANEDAKIVLDDNHEYKW